MHKHQITMGKANSKLSQQNSGRELVTENKIHVKVHPTVYVYRYVSYRRAFLGLDNSGKTSIIEYMATKTFQYCPPTQSKEMKTTTITNFVDTVTFEAVDVPGGNK
jgi:GTP-binding protein EngB required for normal cell division